MTRQSAARNSKRSEGSPETLRRVSPCEQTARERADYISYRMLFTQEYHYPVGRKIVKWILTSRPFNYIEDNDLSTARAGRLNVITEPHPYVSRGK